MEKRSRGFHVNPEEEPSNPLHQLDCQGGFHLKPRGRTQASLDCRAIAHLVWHGGGPLETPRKNPTATPGSGFSLRFPSSKGIFFRSAHVLARREPQCPTRASVPDEGLSARRKQVRASPTRSPHGPPHGPPHDSPHTEADLRRIDGLQFPIQWKTSIWYAFAAYAEPTPDN